MSNELVKRLVAYVGAGDITRGTVSITRRDLTDAIAYINTSRDEVLDVEAMCRAHHSVRSQQGFTTVAWDKLEERNREQYREAMRASLKSAPFTRTDGTTSPERGTVEDRRVKRYGRSIDRVGGIFGAPWRKGINDDGSYNYGRRSGDRARWTAAPVVEPVSEFCGRAPYHHCWQTTPHGHDICVECKLTRTTQPAQEASQSQSLPRPRRMAFTNALVHAINSNSMENGSNTPDYILTSFLEQILEAFDYAVNAREKHYGRELDARQGEK